MLRLNEIAARGLNGICNVVSKNFCFKGQRKEIEMKKLWCKHKTSFSNSVMFQIH